jgi:hypothetical protein
VFSLTLLDCGLLRPLFRVFDGVLADGLGFPYDPADSASSAGFWRKCWILSEKSCMVRTSSSEYSACFDGRATLQSHFASGTGFLGTMPMGKRVLKNTAQHPLRVGKRTRTQAALGVLC